MHSNFEISIPRYNNTSVIIIQTTNTQTEKLPEVQISLGLFFIKTFYYSIVDLHKFFIKKVALQIYRFCSYFF